MKMDTQNIGVDNLLYLEFYIILFPLFCFCVFSKVSKNDYVQIYFLYFMK